MLSKEGIPDHTVKELLESNPTLSEYAPQTWISGINLFKNQGFKTDSILRIFNKHPKILTCPQSQLIGNLELWRASQLGERYVQILVTEHPHLLDFKLDNRFTEQRFLERLMFLKEYVLTRKNVWRLLVNCPNLIVDPLDEIKAKRKYFDEEMKVEHTEVVKTGAFSHSLEKIRTRHEFLVRLGMYKPKNPKADPTIPSSNPSLYQIFDTSDKRFATKVALVSLDEFEVFEQLFKMEKKRDTTSSWDDHEDEFDDDQDK